MLLSQPFRIHSNRLRLESGRSFRRSSLLRSSRPQAVHSDTRFDGYRASVAFLFPGQGAQKVGMAKEVVNTIPSAKELFHQASDILGYNLLQICTDGPKGELDSTVISQPALYVSSLAAVEKLKSTQGQDVIDACDVTCGLSLGEYTALTFAGALRFEDGLKLVKLRGEAMQAAADASSSGMVSVIGLDVAKVEELCSAATAQAGNGESVKIANLLCPGNYTVSGSSKACEIVEKIAKPEFGARMTVKLAVAGAFHTEFMSPAVEKLQEALMATKMLKPCIPVISNVDFQPHSDPDEIKKILAKQVTSPVRWEQSIKALFDHGLERSYELGPGKVISGILRRIDKSHPVENIEV